MSSAFRKILIANRGEIAIRVMRAANEMGKKTVAVYAEEDKLSLHRFKADEAYHIGAGLGPVAAYLSIDEIVRVAKMSGADAVHPGYGLLSENPNLVDACRGAGLAFIGPSAETMRELGDKASARKVAMAAAVPVVPATDVLPKDIEEISELAKGIGFPLMLKASWGGGGRGMRPVLDENELSAKILEGRREAQSAFGNDEGYLEKLIARARHVEVQILGDKFGTIFHLWERDCSVQRRNQKVVERAPAPYLKKAQREQLCGYATAICQKVGYYCAGTVEFLMDMDTEKFFFIEVNPRIQVEHTVTEEVTGIDIVRAQILLAEGKTITESTGKIDQDSITLNGHAIQCRITSEDPQNNFIPDYGRITAYRGATGMGIRLDGGTAYSGAVITRYYDSLLEKVTAWAPTPKDAIARMDRALREFRIRGVSTNIAFVENLLKHPTFTNNLYSTKFIDTTPDLFDFDKRKDRATKLLTYIAEVSVNGHPEILKGKSGSFKHQKIRIPDMETENYDSTAWSVFSDRGPEALSEWIMKQKSLLITDTTMRDGHQSLLATRMRTVDMESIAQCYNATMQNLFSIECWGGATFDVAYRFLQECPWERLRSLRKKMPNLLLQMLLRGSNAVGYTNYPDNVVEGFVSQAAKSGVDVFRVFDSLNWIDNMRVAMDAVLKSGKILEASMCYTGNLMSTEKTKYDLNYYLDLANKLKKAGTHIIGVKDMAGLLKPEAAKILFSALKEEIGLPVHFHTHDTSGLSAATVLAASDAGVDIVDVAMDAFSGGTSQPCMGSILSALEDTNRKTLLKSSNVRTINEYWEQVRAQYKDFESGLASPASEVFLHQMPGGQFTNLKAQARSLGLEDRWQEVALTYTSVNDMFGDIVKVTPSSKVVGDMALMMVAQDLTREDVEDPAVEVNFPKSVIEMFRGDIGQPPGGFPKELVKKALKSETPDLSRPGSRLAAARIGDLRKTAKLDCLNEDLSGEEFNSYLMYPKVFQAFVKNRQVYGPVSCLPTDVFFYGMEAGQEISSEIDPGKTLEVRLQAFGETNNEGEVKVFFELNGQPRVIRIRDAKVADTVKTSEKADLNNVCHLGAPMPGIITSVNVVVGQKVIAGDLLVTLEAMKMETGLYAEKNAIIKHLHVSVGTQIDAKDLLVEFESQTTNISSK
ncbi:MAG: pyruvate carboxylase [Rhodobacteraceae bacterium]|nr:MAG: pyruvate carboxylase [Paracoccaceae bacterium]